VVVADTAPGPSEEDTRYQVLCRRHHVRGQLGPTPTGPGQLSFPGQQVADEQVSVRL